MPSINQSMFDDLLIQFDRSQNVPIKLMFDSYLNDEQLTQLTHYINDHLDKFALAHVSVYVDKEMLHNPKYHSLLETLNKTRIRKLDLAFPANELEVSDSEIVELLDKYVSSRVHYPVIVCEQSSPVKQVASKKFNSFNEKIITKTQRHNQSLFLGLPSNHSAALLVDNEQNDEISAKASDKKIKLKELINQTYLESLDQHIKLEVQHTQIEQQQQVEEEIIDVAIQEQEQEQSLFDGALVDFNLFKNTPYRSRVHSATVFDAFQYELFGNMSKAIKFLSHEAALEIAGNAGALVALNSDNLPQNFILKKTQKGELVLDYDSYADERQINVFTPKILAQYSSDEFIYDQVELPESIKAIAATYNIDPSRKQLDNLWVRYGEKGVNAFFAALGEPGSLSTFIIQSYLSRFPHWDRFLDNQQFIASLEKITIRQSRVHLFH